MNLEYLFSPTKQFTYPSGKLLDGGKIYVYFKDTENLATLYSPEGTFVSNPILLDANGRASVRADVAYQYRLEIYTNKDVLLYTCEAFCEGDGSGGFSFVIHDETLSGNGTAANPLGVINIPLAVDETMTAYTATVEEKESLVLGVNGDWFTDTFGSALNDKVDWSSFSACCSAVKGSLDNKLDISSFDLSNYYNKQETNTLLEQRVDRNEFTQTMNLFNENKQDKLTFDYNENSAISAINGSALAGQGGGEGSCPWISGGKEIAEAQTLTSNMLFQALSSFTLSGDHNHFISVKGGIYRFPNEWELASGIAITNYFMPQSSFSSYSATIAGDISTLYGQDGYLSGQIGTLSGVLKSTSSTVNSNSGNWGKAYTATTANSGIWNRAYTACTANSGKWTSVYNTVNGNSGIWNGKLDASSFTAYTAQADETYLLIPGDGIAISSNTADATTTIWFTGASGGSLDYNDFSAGEGIDITSANNKLVITNNISAGDNISLVYDSTTNKIRIDCEVTGSGGDLTNYYKKTETSSKSELSTQFNNIYTKTETSSKTELKNAFANAGHTYTGVLPINVDNINNEISISGESLSAGPGIDLFASGGYVVISAEDQSNCHCIKFTDTLTSVDLENYSAYDKVTVVNAQQYGSDCELHWDGNTKVFPSGLYCELVRGTNNNSDKWSFMTSGWTNDSWWDYD